MTKCLSVLVSDKLISIIWVGWEGGATIKKCLFEYLCPMKMFVLMNIVSLTVPKEECVSNTHFTSWPASY